jgi:N6-L-threonylcarbamoyladenine synthase
MYVLGIETSCDETSAAVLTDRHAVLSNVILSQDEIHAPYGGVVPELASRQHIRSIDLVVAEALAKAGVALPAIDVYAVTQGPGLIGSLLVGLSFAKGLAYFHGRPLFGVDHLEGHIEAAFLENRDIPFPALALLVSGGHTSLFRLDKKLSFELLGRTRDDAAGEALDKIAKFLGLGYPGGPVIERLAVGGDPDAFAFALPRIKDKTAPYDFSFSGLKTAALRHIRESGIAKDRPRLADFLASFEEAVARTLVATVARAVEEHDPKSLVLCGGVARNRRLRARFEERAACLRLPAFIPSPKLCTDNAAMIAAVALERLEAGVTAPRDLDLDAYPR